MDVNLSKYKNVLIPKRTIEKFNLQDRDDDDIPEYAKWFGVVLINQSTGKIIDQDNIFETKLLLKRYCNLDLKPQENTKNLRSTRDFDKGFKKKSYLKFDLRKSSLGVHRSKIINTLGVIYDKKNEGESSIQTPKKTSWIRNIFQKMFLKKFRSKIHSRKKIEQNPSQVPNELQYRESLTNNWNEQSTSSSNDKTITEKTIGDKKLENKIRASQINMSQISSKDTLMQTKTKIHRSSIRTIYKNSIDSRESEPDSVVLQYYDQTEIHDMGNFYRFQDRNYALRRSNRWTCSALCKCCMN